ncbi:hypothetical protein CDL15_Pgr013201 [Punica granatum]|nr:hypothetical protein CDL15_Pgr013201 [Punica granatum]
MSANQTQDQLNQPKPPHVGQVPPALVAPPAPQARQPVTTEQRVAQLEQSMSDMSAKIASLLALLPPQAATTANAALPPIHIPASALGFHC